MTYQAWRRYRSGVTQSGTGFIVPTSVGPTLRALVLNGTTQRASVDLPNTSTWNSIGAVKVIWRMRGLTDDQTRVTFIWLGPTYSMGVSTGGSSARLDFSDGRDSINIFHTPTLLSDVVGKLQFDPANTRWTLETWKGDGTGHLQGTVGLTTTSNLDLSDTFFLGSNSAGSVLSNAHFDWLGIQTGVDALDVFPGAEPAAGTYLALWKFDGDDGTDSSGNSLTLTLVGSPTFENTP